MALRSARITLSASFAALVATATGCSDPEPPDHAQICMEELPETRVDDERCEDGGPGVVWVYVPRSFGAPATGDKVLLSTYTRTRPSLGSISTVRPAGFGGSAYNDSGGGSAGS